MAAATGNQSAQDPGWLAVPNIFLIHYVKEPFPLGLEPDHKQRPGKHWGYFMILVYPSLSLLKSSEQSIFTSCRANKM